MTGKNNDSDSFHTPRSQQISDDEGPDLEKSMQEHDSVEVNPGMQAEKTQEVQK